MLNHQWLSFPTGSSLRQNCTRLLQDYNLSARLVYKISHHSWQKDPKPAVTLIWRKQTQLPFTRDVSRVHKNNPTGSQHTSTRSFDRARIFQKQILLQHYISVSLPPPPPQKTIRYCLDAQKATVVSYSKDPWLTLIVWYPSSFQY